MNAVDTNVLVYAHREDSPFHGKALAVMVELAEGAAPWAIPWPCVHEFLAIVTHPRIYDPPTPLDIAMDAIQAWTDSPTCRLLGEGPGYFKRFREIAEATQIAGPMVHDARVAAICLHNGVTALLSCDRDFSRFTGLRTRNPLT